MHKEFTVQSWMFIAGEEPWRQSRSTLPVIAPRNIRLVLDLKLSALSTHSGLRLSLKLRRSKGESPYLVTLGPGGLAR